jgi:Putative restriction endonuclease
MVAQRTISQPPNVPPASSASRFDDYGPVRFTVTDALRMVKMGILPEDSTIELLDGSLIYCDRFARKGGQIVEGLAHNYVVSLLAELASKIDSDNRHLRTQSTLICSETHAPIPDAVLLKGPRSAYRDHIPSASEALFVIEVADSSYERDSGEKLRGYARAGIAQYIIINLRNRTAETYTNPDTVVGTYPPPQIISVGGAISLQIGEEETLTVSMSDLLP